MPCFHEYSRMNLHFHVFSSVSKVSNPAWTLKFGASLSTKDMFSGQRGNCALTPTSPSGELNQASKEVMDPGARLQYRSQFEHNQAFQLSVRGPPDFIAFGLGEGRKAAVRAGNLRSGTASPQFLRP
jgi:hypothetical protein